jgi:hypothetical protein
MATWTDVTLTGGVLAGCDFLPVPGLPGAFFAAGFLSEAEDFSAGGDLWREILKCVELRREGEARVRASRLSPTGPRVAAFTPIDVENGKEEGDVGGGGAGLFDRRWARVFPEDSKRLCALLRRVVDDDGGRFFPQGGDGADALSAGPDSDSGVFQVSLNVYDWEPASEFALDIHKDSVGRRVLIVSLGGTVTLDLWKIEGHPIICWHTGDADPVAYPPDGSVICPPGSALLLTGPSFEQYAHGIEPRAVDDVSPARRHLYNNWDISGLPADTTTLHRSSRASIIMWS